MYQEQTQTLWNVKLTATMSFFRYRNMSARHFSARLDTTDRRLWTCHNKISPSDTLGNTLSYPTRQVDKTKVMASDGIACCILIHTHSLISDYRRCWVYDGIPYQVKQSAGDHGITAENMQKSQCTDFNKDTTNESASVACSNILLWKLDSQKQGRNTSWCQ